MENGVEKMPRGSKNWMSCMNIFVVNKRDIEWLDKKYPAISRRFQTRLLQPYQHNEK